MNDSHREEPLEKGAFFKLHRFSPWSGMLELLGKDRNGWGGCNFYFENL